jgi:7-cyano-7-deazaguanine synthase in queuosine biosynthesis
MSNLHSGKGVTLLWTGGWDSTYRLMCLVLTHKARTQPLYVLDTGRPSTLTELDAMTAIRRRLLQEHPHTAELLLPVELVLLDDIPGDPDIESKHRELKRQNPDYPNQYNWLARLAKARGIEGLELCVEKHIGGGTFESLRNVIELVHDDEYPTEYYRVADNPANPALRLFHAFRFPLLGIDKMGMGRAAAEQGFGSYLEMTWFCHRPLNGRPCGTCSPCRDAADLGLKRRVPWRNRTLRRYLSAPLWRAKDQFLEFLRPRRRLRQLLGRGSESGADDSVAV